MNNDLLPIKPIPLLYNYRNPKKVVITREVYFINSEAYKFYINTWVITYNPERNLVSYYPNIGISISLINRYILDTYYPNIPRQISKDIINLSSIGDSLAIILFIYIPI